jgi:3',5'-cyclic AMP phosphodiesterase CpdA
MLRIALISDVHAFSQGPKHGLGDNGDPSWVRAAPNSEDDKKGPFPALEALIENEGLAADLLVCPGDMGDKADRAGIQFTWGWLETIRRRLDAETLLATTGNHDVDSYDQEGRGDPTNAIMALQPPYPLDDAELRSEYWREGFTLLESDDQVIGLLNTCQSHLDQPSAERGKVTEEQLAFVESRIAHLDVTNRVLVCHHHPFRHDVIDRHDYSEADGGPELLRLLEDNGEWLVIHGHRHYPTISYAGGSSRAPAIVAAGSFSAVLYPELATRVRNQFTIVEIEGAAPITGTSGITGRVRSWEYNVARGWVKPQSQEGIPDRAGFGCRQTASQSAQEMQAAMTKLDPGGFIVLDDLLVELPHLAYLSPRDREAALTELERSGIASVAPDRPFALKPKEIFLKLTVKMGEEESNGDS